MEFAESLRLSWRAIRSHKLRSILTTLGVIIGVAAVITFVTLGTSLRADVLGQVGADRTPNIYVWASPAGQEGGGPGAGAQPVFTASDVDAIRNLSGVESVVARGVVPTAAVSAGGQTVAQRQVVATSPSYFDSGGFTEGRAFREGSREVVLNEQAAGLFSPSVEVGDNVTLRLATGNSVEAEVVGLLNGSSGGGAFEGLGQSQPLVFVPTDPFYQTTLEVPGSGESQRVYPTLTVVAEDFAAVPDTKASVQAYLENESDAAKLVPGNYEFSAETDQDLVDQIKELLNTLTNFVTGIAVISLVVGSIGIANIMLVSVTERTKEIGIMKAVGAQNRDVLQLFLLEAAMLGLFGSVLGTPVGVLGAYAAAQYIGLSLVLPYEWFAIAVAVGIIVGILAGLYPAWNAAKTDPIDALRYE